MKKSDIGVIGLAVMGEGLALNLEDKGYRVSVYNRPHPSHSVVQHFMQEYGKGRRFEGFEDLKTFVQSLERPRKILMMVKAGTAVDQVIEQLLPLLESGDILIDGGNSNFEDTERRVQYVESKGYYYIGAGVSGGQEGALHGASIMPGGSEKAWPEVREILQRIAAKAEDGSPCCEWIGGGGAGHFVKMVHNGIEYADMELIAEAYFVMKQTLNTGNLGIATWFEEWNKGKLKSYLIEITADILRHKDTEGNFLIDKILDVAGQKGTGRWSVIQAMELGIPLNLIATAVFQRDLSSHKDLRITAARKYKTDAPVFTHNPEIMHQEIHDSLYASKIISYTQGFALMQQASEHFHWELNLAAIARIWRAGCIIRAALLTPIAEIFDSAPHLENLLLSPWFREQIREVLPNWKALLIKTTRENTAVPAFAAALNYFYSLTTQTLPANLIQAQRDYFGAHTFERTDRPRNEFFHEDWTGEGNDTHAGIYNA